MKSPFPGMDPYLELPSLWAEVHHLLISSLALELAPKLAPRYYVGVERRIYMMRPEELILVGVPDFLVMPKEKHSKPAQYPLAAADVAEVEIPEEAMEYRHSYLVIREVPTREVVTVVELLSPANKSWGGREEYLQKRLNMMKSLTSLVEIDLLREGEPMPVVGHPPQGDYRILVSRAWERPKAWLFPFSVRDKIPAFPLPLRENEEPIWVNLNKIFHSLYTRARYDLQLDYTRPAVPPLSEEDAAWAKTLMEKAV